MGSTTNDEKISASKRSLILLSTRFFLIENFGTCIVNLPQLRILNFIVIVSRTSSRITYFRLSGVRESCSLKMSEIEMAHSLAFFFS